MSNLFFETMIRLTPELRAGKFANCEAEVVKTLDTFPDSPFHLAAELVIQNDPAAAAAHFDAFFLQESDRYDIAAAYTSSLRVVIKFSSSWRKRRSQYNCCRFRC